MTGKKFASSSTSSIKITKNNGPKVVIRKATNSGAMIPKVPKYESSKTSKTVTKNHFGGCSSKFKETHMAGGFVDKRSGNEGYKQSVKHESSVKVNDKIHGCTTEYQTQVKFTKTTTLNNSQTKGSGSGGGKSGGGGGSNGSGNIYIGFY